MKHYQYDSLFLFLLLHVYHRNKTCKKDKIYNIYLIYLYEKPIFVNKEGHFRQILRQRIIAIYQVFIYNIFHVYINLKKSHYLF